MCLISNAVRIDFHKYIPHLIHNQVKFICSKAGAFQIVAGWWGHQPRQPAVGGVSTAHMQSSKATI